MGASEPIDTSWHELILVHQLDRTIKFARLRCLPRQHIIEQVLNMDNDDLDAYLYRLRELEPTISELEFIADAMTGLASKYESASPETKLKVDKALLRLIHLLPAELAYRFAEPYLDHPRKTRRKWAYAALRGKPLAGTAVEKFARVFRELNDKATLPFITMNPQCVQALGADFLLRRLNEKDQGYFRARVLGALLSYDRVAAVALSHNYPWEFVYAAGRSGDKSLLLEVRGLFEANAQNGEFLSIYAWALGKLGADDDLNSLEQFVERKRVSSGALGYSTAEV
jgi:hypothetical protein